MEYSKLYLIVNKIVVDLKNKIKLYVWFKKFFFSK